MKIAVRNLEGLDEIMADLLRESRIPGVALAVIADESVVYAKGFGYRDPKRKLAMTPDTIYPIASTTKALNATLLGMLADEGRFDWDAPVQHYLPEFRLQDRSISARVTPRDLVTMRTGLPRHDWVWVGSRASRAELVRCLAHLDLSADFRQRFQYCNLSVTAAGHLAEAVTGKTWETLIRERILQPLGMRRTTFARPGHDGVTLSYHESSRRKLLVTRRRASESTAPSGGSIHSTVRDMARWVQFNLNGGLVNRRRLIKRETLADIHAPQVIIGDRPLAGFPPDGAYALGWLVDTCNGHKRISHGGYLYDVTSNVALFPQLRVGMVAFSNFGSPLAADAINQCAFDLLMGRKPAAMLREKLAQYESKVKETRQRNAAVVRSRKTGPSHPLSAYAGRYGHPGYGEILIRRSGRKLLLKRHDLILPLQHWHYDAWVAQEHDMWPIHVAHAFDVSCQIRFSTAPDGGIDALSIPFESAVAPIRFTRKKGRFSG